VLRACMCVCVVVLIVYSVYMYVCVCGAHMALLLESLVDGQQCVVVF
jgi:hypothetical protein